VIRRRYAKYPPGAAGHDTEALQTDVMRFMAIIGLCLMAVFALVQGIPVQEKGKAAQSAQAARLREEVRVQQLGVQELQLELQGLKAGMQRTRQQLATAEQSLDQVKSRARQARSERDRLLSQVQDLENQLERKQHELAAISQSAMQKEQDLAALQGRLSGVRASLEQNRRKLAALQREIRPAVPASPVAGPPDPEPVRPTKATPQRQGFTLRFVSGAALDALVAAGSVTLYAMADRQVWRLSLEAGRVVAAREPSPGWFHEMSSITVPEHYLQGLANAPDAPGVSGIVWGVQLPSTTRQAIASLTRGRQGGELVIRADGRVELSE
jgi:hypothetical protein